MRRFRSGPFAMFDGELVEATFTSAPVDLDVKPIPDGPPVDAVGELALACEPPLQRGSGPVVMRVALTGFGNVRAAEPPRFERGVAGTLQIEGGEVTRRARGAHGRDDAAVAVPDLSVEDGHARGAGADDADLRPARGRASRAAVREHVPATSLRRRRPRRRAAARGRRRSGFRGRGSLGGAALLLALLIALAARCGASSRCDAKRARSCATRRPRRSARAWSSACRSRSREASDRGDAWRALRSLLDAAERERDIAVGAEEEMMRACAKCCGVIPSVSRDPRGGRRGTPPRSSRTLGMRSTQHRSSTAPPSSPELPFLRRAREPQRRARLVPVTREIRDQVERPSWSRSPAKLMKCRTSSVLISRPSRVISNVTRSCATSPLSSTSVHSSTPQRYRSSYSREPRRIVDFAVGRSST